MFNLHLHDSFIKRLRSVLVGLGLVLGILLLAGSPFLVEEARAASGYSINALEDGGPMKEVFLDSSTTSEACVGIEMYETAGSSNQITAITVELMEDDWMPGFAPSKLSSVSLYIDVDNSQNLDPSVDTFVASSDPNTWTQLSNPTRWRHTFSSLTISIPTSFSNMGSGRVLIAAKPTQAALDEGAMRSFFIQIPESGVVVSVDSSATLTNFPAGSGEMSGIWMSPPINIGQEGGSGNWGGSVVISEIQTIGGTASDDFVELYNRGDALINLAGFRLLYFQPNATELSATTAAGVYKFPTSQGDINIQAGGFYLVANTNYDGAVAPDATTTTDIPNSGFVALMDDMGGILDTVGYGSVTDESLAEGSAPAFSPSSAHQSLERKARPGSTPSSMAIGGTDADQGNGEDTNYNAGDFILRSVSDPQNSMAEPEIMGGGMGLAGTPILINEVFYNTSSTSGWIELYNRDTTSGFQDISGWTITSNGSTYTLPSTSPVQNVPPAGFVTVYWNRSGTDDSVTSTSISLYTGQVGFNDLGDKGGDVVLKDKGGAIKDYVQYGGPGSPNEAAALSAGEWFAGDYVPNVLYGQSIGRRSMEGEDYNDKEDWQAFASPSPGSPNMGGDTTAPTKVSNVVLADNDSMVSSGLDGNDITVSWTPGTTPDPSFDHYAIYLLPEGTGLDTASHSPIKEIYAGQYQYDSSGNALASYSWTGGPMLTKDSAGTDLADGQQYRAYVLAVDMAGNESPTAVSGATTLSEEVYEAANDSQAPFIMHMPVWQAKAGTDIVLMVRADDDRSLGGNVPQMVYKIGDDNTPPNDLSAGASTINCAPIESSFYKCTLPFTGGWNSTGIIGYYLKLTDEAGNTRYLSADPSADEAGNLSQVQQSPIQIEILAPASDPLGDYSTDGSPDFSGNVYKGNGTVFADGDQPWVFVAGTALGPIQASNTTGAFLIPDGSLVQSSYDIVAFHEGYKDMVITEFYGQAGIDFYLNEGNVDYGSGGGDQPFVAWTSPNDGMNNIRTNIYCSSECSQSLLQPSDEPIIIGFSKQMDASTIDDQDASNANSNIYLTTNGNDRIAGKVKYVWDDTQGINEARFYSSSQDTLSPDTFYTIVVTQGVTDLSGNPIMGGAGEGGAFVSGFSTMPDNSSMWGLGWQEQEGGGEGYADMDFSDYGRGGEMMPPYIRGVVPMAGGFDIPRNRALLIEFSQPMDPTTITSSTIKLYPISNEQNWTLGPAVPGSVRLDKSTKTIVTFTPSSPLNLNTSNSGWYELQIMGAVKSGKGIWYGDPRECGTQNPDTCLGTKTYYTSDFQVSSTVAGDTTAPTIVATYPENNKGIAAGTEPVEVGIPSLDIAFSEPMLPSTINAQNITLKASNSTVLGKVVYAPSDNTAKFIPANVLQPNTQYTLQAGIGVQDLAGQALSANYSISFKTGGADTSAPEVLYANADDYSIAITFSEPMNSAKQTDTNKWGTSVLNPANYYLKGEAMVSGAMTPVSPYKTEDNQPLHLSQVPGLTFRYEDENNTVYIEGLDFNQTEPHATNFQVYIDNVTDKSNNEIQGSGQHSDANKPNASAGPVESSAETYGMLGPGGGGMMMMGPTPGAMGPGMDMGMMGMKGGGAMPMNMTAGQTSMYFVDIPLTEQIDSGGTIILTFPSGFDVASAQQDINSPANQDFNESGPGTITFACSDFSKNCAGGVTVTGDGASDATKGGLADDGVTVNTSSRTVTIHINGATQPNDFLHLDIKGIINSSIPKEFGTNGYAVDIKTRDSSGTLLETVDTMPFYLQQGGSLVWSGTVSVVQGDGATPIIPDNGETMSVYLGSPMTGPMEAEVEFDGAGNTATYSFTGLAEGEYHLFTEPSITLSSGGTSYEFSGIGMPDPKRITASFTKNITLTRIDSNSGTAVTVSLQGDFSSAGAADDVDIFASSPSGFRVKTVTPANDGVDANTSHNYTLYLPDGNWRVGIGPAMPKGPMAGPPKMPDWMPPSEIDVAVEAGVAIPSAIAFDISNQQTYAIYGQVVDDSGAGIASADVWGFNPMAGFGDSYTQTDSNGNFALKVGITGIFKVGARKSGLPEPREKAVDVRASGVYYNETLITPSHRLILSMKKPSYTISGKVLDANSKAVAYVPVWADQVSGWGHTETMTDASGNYILYVDNGSWIIETDIPNYGWFQHDLTISIDNASQSNVILKPSTDTNWVDISGTVTIAGTAQQYMPIRAVAYDTNGNYLGREFGSMTDSNGNYNITVPGTDSPDSYNYYRVDIWTPDYGEVERTDADDVSDSPANTKVNNADKTGVDITIAAGALEDVTVIFTNGADYSDSEAFLNIDGFSLSGGIGKPTGFHKTKRITDLSATTTLQLQQGNYDFSVNVTGLGEYIPNEFSRDQTTGYIVVGSTGASVVFDLPSGSTERITYTARVQDTSGTGLSDAWFWVGNHSTGYHQGCSTDASGNCSLTVPKLSSGSYMLGADKPGYASPRPTRDPGSTSSAKTIVLTKNDYTISGYIYNDADSDNTYDAGEAIANGWIEAQEITTGKKSFAPVDGSGFYELGVSPGTWQVFGMADAYQRTKYSISGASADLVVSNASLTNKHIKLIPDNTWTSNSKSKPIKPSSGGVIDDTDADGTGVKLTVPPQALGNSTNNASLSIKETSAVASTNSTIPFGSKGKSITGTDNSGQAITDLSDYVDLELVLYKADVDAEVADGNLVDKTKLKALQVGYWDDTISDWVNLPTTRNAYYKAASGDTEWTLYSGSATQTGYEKFIDDALGRSPTFTDYADYKLVLKSSTNHFSVFGATQPRDSLYPAPPTGLAQTSGNGTSVALSWTAVTTNSDNTAITDLLGYELYRCASSCGSDSNFSQVNTSDIITNSYTDSGLSPWTTYYYKVTAADDSGNETSLASSTALQVCSNKTVDNGAVSANCSITCDSGYTQTGHTCEAESAGAVIIPPTAPPVSGEEEAVGEQEKAAATTTEATSTQATSPTPALPAGGPASSERAQQIAAVRSQMLTIIRQLIELITQLILKYQQQLTALLAE